MLGWPDGWPDGCWPNDEDLPLFGPFGLFVPSLLALMSWLLGPLASAAINARTEKTGTRKEERAATMLDW